MRDDLIRRLRMNQQKVRDNPQTQVIKQALAQGTRNLKIVSDGGVTIVLGTDSGTDEGRWQGYFEQLCGRS